MIKRRLSLALCIAVALAVFTCGTALASSQKTYMQVDSDTASYYKSKSTSHKISTLNLGAKVRVLSEGSTWTKVEIKDQERYIKTSDLAKRKVMPSGSYVIAYKKASSKSSKMGYVLLGTTMTVKAEVTKNGTKYLKVSIPCSYTNSKGSSKKHSSTFTAYVKDSKVKNAYTEKKLKKKCTLHKKPKSSSSGSSLKAGKVVKVLRTGKTWAKVKVGDDTGYVKKSNLKDRTMYVVKSTTNMKRAVNSDSKILASSSFNSALKVRYTYKTKAGASYAYCVKGSKKGFVPIKTSHGVTFLDSSRPSGATAKSTIKYLKIHSTVLYKSPKGCGHGDGYQAAAACSKTHRMIKYNDPLIILGVTKKVGNYNWYKVKIDGKTWYLYAPKSGSYFMSKPDNFRYSTSNKYQRAVINKALEIALESKTLYANDYHANYDSNGVFRSDCVTYYLYVMRNIFPGTKWSFNRGRLLLDVIHDGETVGTNTDGSKLKAKVTWKRGTKAKWSNHIKPGDLMYFKVTGDRRATDHVGIYLGNGCFVHSARGEKSIVVYPMDSYYKKKLYRIVRVLPS